MDNTKVKKEGKSHEYDEKKRCINKRGYFNG